MARNQKESKKVSTHTDAAGKAKALDHTLGEVAKRYGDEAIMRLGAGYVADVDAISTGSLSLDAAMGVGGVPRGRIAEFFGPESSGKTTVALHCIASAQREGGTAAFIDAEHALDPSYARKLGVNLDNLLISQPDNGEQALEIVDLLVRSGAVDIIVVDSVAALTPREEIDGEMGKNHVGLQARLMSHALRKLTAIIKRSNTSVIFINQIRMKIGVMFGSPETTPGGNALKFYCSLRCDIRRTGSVKDGDTAIGNNVRVKVVKNKVAPPFRQGHFEIRFDQGIFRLGEILDLGVEQKILTKNGSWLSYGDIRLGQGQDKAADFLRENPDVLAEIEEKVRASLLPQCGSDEEDTREDEGNVVEEEEAELAAVAA